jgi:hypothetical protein
MLRVFVLALGVLAMLGGFIPAALGGKALFVPIVIGAVLILSTLFERIVYKPTDTRAPGAGWERTEERFVDPTSGKQLTVFVKPATGERRYVETA